MRKILDLVRTALEANAEMLVEDCEVAAAAAGQDRAVGVAGIAESTFDHVGGEQSAATDTPRTRMLYSKGRGSRASSTRSRLGAREFPCYEQNVFRHIPVTMSG